MKKEKGFTFSELMIVIAIIGVLATVVLTNLKKADKKSREAKAVTALRSVSAAMQLCLMKSKLIRFPSDATTGGGIICDNATTTWPSLDRTDFVYNCGSVACNNSITFNANAGITSDPNLNSGTFYISIYSLNDGNGKDVNGNSGIGVWKDRRIFACGSNGDYNGLYGLNIPNLYNFTGVVTCVKYGF